MHSIEQPPLMRVEAIDEKNKITNKNDIKDYSDDCFDTNSQLSLISNRSKSIGGLSKRLTIIFKNKKN